jgi:lactoylglutathione lyase
MATIDHVALWTSDLERVRVFYERYFDVSAGEQYVNAEKDFSSYFLEFESGTRLELMHMPDIDAASEDSPTVGYAHIAISVGSEHAVDTLTERLREDGYTVRGEPRWTGDGYYESVVLDPDDNRIEITV